MTSKPKPVRGGLETTDALPLDLLHAIVGGSPERNGGAEKVIAEVTSAAADLAEMGRDRILARARFEGWSIPQADWLARLALEPLFEAVANDVPGPDALDEAYRIACRKLAVAYFNNALNEGKDRRAAFLTVVDLHRQVAEQRDAAPVDYPDEILIVACRAVEAAHATGASSADQVAAGYAVIRQLLEKPAV
jgi:hypothetical protein